ncbi:MAG TPA: hypothetical protein VK360_07835 [Acidimicrobiales bacterium]|nr:hypothetical protein [Acidimicrobiales bacterium]
MLTADPDADLELSLAEWRRYRRRKRLADIHWIDAMYQAYMTAIFSAVALYLLAAAVGDGPRSANQLARVVAEGGDWLGAVVAVALATGLRSGSRGGPLALERAEVRHVLLAPVDRTAAVRGPVLRRLRFLVFVASVVGVVAGLLASRRLEHHAVVWMACGALFAVSVVVLAYGAALCASAGRLPPWLGTVISIGLGALAVADGLNLVNGSPLTAWGRIGLWPEDFSMLGLAAMAVSLGVLCVGLARVGDLSVEAAERRSTLVGQLRFAATLQDLRTVIVLRRQLAMELPRLRPWVRLGVRGTGWFPVWTRGWRGVLRWPAARVGRMVLLAVAAGLAQRGVWAGTTPLLAVAALALYVAGLDAVEPLAQEIDHPTRSRSVPIERSAIHLRHLPVGVAVMVAVAAVAATAGLLVEPSLGGLAVSAICVVPAAMGSVAGAATSVLSGMPEVAGGDAWSLVPPEVAGMRIVVRAVWPPALATLGTLPVLAARAAADNGRPAASAAGAAAVGVVAVFVLVAGWVRTRDRLHAWWKAAMDQMFPEGKARAQEGTAHAA